MKCECILEKLRMDETGEDKIDGFINKLEDYVKEIIHLITEPTDECFVKLSEGKNDCIERMNILKKSIKELEPIYSDFADIIVKLRQGKSNLESICNDESDLMEKDIYLPDNYGSHYDKIVRSFNELGDIVRQIKYFIAEPTDKCFEKFPGGKEICIKRMNTLKKSKQKLEHLFCEFVAFLSKLDSLQSVEDQLNLEPVPDPKVQDANDWTERMKHLPNSGSYWVDHRSEMEENVFKFESKLTAFENVSEIKEISEKEMSDLRILSEMLIKYMPMLEDPCSEIDDILYENDEHKVVEEKDCHIAPDLLLPFHDKINDIGHVYFSMVFDKNIVNQCLDNAFLKLVEHRGWRRTFMRLDGNIVHLLESKDMYQICLGLKLCKTYSKANGFKKRIEQDLYCAISYLTKIPEFVDDQNVNRMARFVAKHAKECHDLIKEKNKLPEIPAYRARDIFMKIKYGEIIGQYEIKALYEIIKSCKSPSKVLSILLGYGKIEKVVTVFLRRIRYCYMQYEALDKEMRKIDRQNGQEFGGFSLEIVADDDVKKPLCASDSLEKSTFYKYFFYDDAMMTFSILSFLYNCFEKDLFYSYEAQQFKMASVLTKVVLDLIHQLDTTKKVNKPIWIIEKILNTCHFIVFGQDEKKEKDIFLKLVNGQIDEDELISLKGFMKKNNLSYKDIERDFDTVEENEHGDEDIDCDFDALESENSYEDMDYD